MFFLHVRNLAVAGISFCPLLSNAKGPAGEFLPGLLYLGQSAGLEQVHTGIIKGGDIA